MRGEAGLGDTDRTPGVWFVEDESYSDEGSIEGETEDMYHTAMGYGLVTPAPEVTAPSLPPSLSSSLFSRSSLLPPSLPLSLSDLAHSERLNLLDNQIYINNFVVFVSAVTKSLSGYGWEGSDRHHGKYNN